MGIKGASILCTQPSFDLSTGVAVDVMYCVFSGVVEKTMMKFWFGIGHRGKPFSIKRKVSCVLYINKIYHVH